MDIATESERIIRLKEVIPIERGLLEAGFVTDPHTSLLTGNAVACASIQVRTGYMAGILLPPLLPPG